MKHKASILVAVATVLSGCATTTSSAEPVEKGGAGTCDATAVQDMIGQTATAELGQELLEKTSAEILRWGPPRSAMTMDYRPNRLTVSYDDNMVIDRISCG